MSMVIVRLTTNDCLTYRSVLISESHCSGSEMKEKEVKKRANKQRAVAFSAASVQPLLKTLCMDILTPCFADVSRSLQHNTFAAAKRQKLSSNLLPDGELFIRAFTPLCTCTLVMTRT